MIPKRSRLPGSEFHGGSAFKTSRTPYFLLKTKPVPQENARIGVVVGKSVHKSAVKRNFWERQAKAILLAEHIKGKDILLILSPRVNELTKKQFQEALHNAIS